jgi:hypothetical protein
MEDILLFSNILDNAKPPRKYRERLLTIDELTDKELRSRYRFGRQSIEIITNLIHEEILHPTQRSHSLSAETQVRKVFFTLLKGVCLGNPNIFP